MIRSLPLLLSSTALGFQRVLTSPARLRRVALLTAFACGAAMSANGDFVDDFNGTSVGAPAGWSDMNLDLRGIVASDGGNLTISDVRGSNPHLLQALAPIGSISAYTLTVNVSSMTATPDVSGVLGEPTAIAAVGAFNGYALVVQFNAATRKFTAFINGPVQGKFAFDGSVPAYDGKAISFVIEAGSNGFTIAAPSFGYKSPTILYSSAIYPAGSVATFKTLEDLGSAPGFILGTESGGSTQDGVCSIRYDRVVLSTAPAAPEVAGDTISDEFIGNSQGVPAAWTILTEVSDPNGSVVENGSLATITDPHVNSSTDGGGGPVLIQSASFGEITSFTARVKIASMSAETGARAQAITGIGNLTTSVLVVQFDAATKNFDAFIFSSAGTARFALKPGVSGQHLPSYAGGEVKIVVTATSDRFSISSPADGYNSGEILFSSARDEKTGAPTTFATLHQLGATPKMIIGGSCDNLSSTAPMTSARVAFDRVDLDTTHVNGAPTARAGADQSIHAGSVVTLNGSTSFDDNTASTSLGYAWTFAQKPEGSTATLNSATLAQPTFVADKTGDYIVALVVTDAQGLTSPADSVIISSNNVAPTAAASVDFNLAVVGNVVHFSGTGSTDPEGDKLTYVWTLTSAPTGSTAALIGATTATPSLLVDREGTFKVTLTVSDFLGAGTPATVEVVATRPAGDPEVRIIYASDVVERLNAAQVTTEGNQRAFGNFLKQATKDLQKGNVAEAVFKLKEAIARTDGYPLRNALDVNGAGRDWITDRAAQLDLYGLLTSAVNALQP